MEEGVRVWRSGVCMEEGVRVWRSGVCMEEGVCINGFPIHQKPYCG